jgi:hypothetical protein
MDDNNALYFIEKGKERKIQLWMLKLEYKQGGGGKGE